MIRIRSQTVVLRAALLAASLAAVACGGTEPLAQGSLRSGLGQGSGALTQAFAAGTLIIPMDNAAQDTGALKAYGLVYQLLQHNIPVRIAITSGKSLGDADFTATTVDLVSSTAFTLRAYKSGPFIIDSADAAAAMPYVTAWQTVNTAVAVHKATQAFTADIQRVLTAAPRTAMLISTHEDSAFFYMNAAGIPDSQGKAWPAAMSADHTYPNYSDILSAADIAGPTSGGSFDGKLLRSDGTPAFCGLTSTHIVSSEVPTFNDEVVRETRAYLTGRSTSAFLICSAALSFDNSHSGHFLSSAGIVNVDATTGGPNPNPNVILAPDSPFAQLDGTWLVTEGTLQSLGLASSSSFNSLVRRLTGISSTPSDSHLGYITGNLDGSRSNGIVTYLAGHEYTVTTPISTHPKSNGARFYLDALMQSPCTGADGQPTLTVTKTAPALTNGSSITFTITVSNAGPGVADSAVLTDVLPAGLTLSSADNNGNGVGQVVTWQLGNLAAGASITVTVVAAVSADATYANSASLAYSVGLTGKTTVSNTTSTVRDATAPDTTITSGPAPSTSSTDATFFIASSEPGSTFTCALDGASFTPCSSPTVLHGISSGAHTFKAAATDPAGNTDQTPASYPWTVTTGVTAPTITSPTVNQTVTTTTPTISGTAAPGAAVTVSVDGHTYGPTTADGNGNWSIPITTPLSSGPHTVQASATVGSGSPVLSGTVPFTINPGGGGAIDTQILTGPPAVTSATSATFTFGSSNAVGAVTFECQLDAATSFTTCPTPYTIAGPLSSGAHTLSVRAHDSAGNIDSTPATASWTVNPSGPTGPTITAPTNNETVPTSTPTITGTAEANSSVEVFIDGQSVGTVIADANGNWSLPLTTPLTDGPHTVQATATGASGQPVSSSTVPFTVDTGNAGPLDTTIISGPPHLTNQSIATFKFGSNQSPVTFECKLDGTAFGDCPNPYTTSRLSDGAHTLAVRAKDAAGNVDQTPATESWTIDTKAPDTTIVTGPDHVTPAATARFTFSASESPVTYQCQLDSAPGFTACTNPDALDNVQAGAHILKVRAKDAAGNVDPTPAEWDWTVQDLSNADFSGAGTGCGQSPTGAIAMLGALLALALRRRRGVA